MIDAFVIAILVVTALCLLGAIGALLLLLWLLRDFPDA